jgi:hypothetical protein
MPSNDYKTRRLLLRAYPQEQPIRGYAREHGWPIAVTTEEDLDQNTVHEIIWLARPSLVMHYAEDRLTGTAYVMASSWSPELAENLSRQLEHDLDVVPLDQLLRAPAEADDAQALSVAINRLSLGAPYEFDRDIFEIVSGGLTHPDHRARHASIWAAAFMPWQEYRPILRRMAASDPDADVREAAADLLQAYRFEEGKA